MRYYNIVITNQSGKVLKQYTSLGTNGQSLPGALQVEFDIPVTTYAVPSGQAFVRIWGVPLQDIAQAADYNRMSASGNGAQVQIHAGMQKGLPLANPAQAGLIVQGTVNQAFGNWVGVNQTLDLILTPPTGTPKAPANIVLNWTAYVEGTSGISPAILMV